MRETNNLHQLWQLQRTALFQCLQCWSLDASVRSSVSFLCQTQHELCSVPRHVGRIPHTGPILEELSLQWYAQCISNGTSWSNVSWQMDWKVRSYNIGTSFPWPKHHLLILLEVHTRCCSGSITAQHCRNVLRGYGLLLQLQLHLWHSVTRKLHVISSPCVTEYGIISCDSYWSY
jgi:hypothetical protein